MGGSHRRLKVLAGEWVLVSPNRTARPWQGEVSRPQNASEPAYDPNCYLCPGNARAGGIRNPAYTGTFVFENDFAALRPNVAKQRLDVEDKGLLVAEAEAGIFRVLCFSPRHDLTLSTMELADIESVVGHWTEQFRELGASKGINYVQIFENRGAMMGASNLHAHGQIWATSSIPEAGVKELLSPQNYLKTHGQCLSPSDVRLEEPENVQPARAHDQFLSLCP